VPTQMQIEPIAGVARN